MPGNSNFQNLINKFGLENFEFKFNNNNHYGIGYNDKDDIYCIINADGVAFEKSYIKEFYFLKKNENGSFNLVNYNGYCHLYYDHSFGKKSKVVEEENERYVINSSFDVFDDELSRKYLDIKAFENIHLDFTNFTNLRNLSFFNNYRYHLFKDGRPNKLRFEEGKLKSKIYVNKQGYCDREDGPAVIVFDKNGELKAEFWYKDDVYYREDGPAVIEYNLEGNPRLKYFFSAKGKYENLKTMLFDKDGKITKIRWKGHSRGKFPTDFVIETNSFGFKNISIGWIRDEDGYLKEGLSMICLNNNVVTLHFSDSNGNPTKDELKCAIMENNLNEVEKKIIRNVEKIRDEEAKNFDRIIKGSNKII